MAENLPVDFEQKVRLPAAVGGAGYPYRISARDLMANFKFLMNQMPVAYNDNDMIILSGGKWIVLAAPSSSGTHVLGCVAGVVQWLATSECT